MRHDEFLGLNPTAAAVDLDLGDYRDRYLAASAGLGDGDVVRHIHSSQVSP
jgi:hypothetical protein